MSKLDIQNLVGNQVYIKGTTIKATIASFTYRHNKVKECIVEMFFEPYNHPDKVCFEKALEIKGTKCHIFNNTNNNGELTFRREDETVYTGIFRLEDLSEVPYGGPIAELIYGNEQ